MRLPRFLSFFPLSCMLGSAALLLSLGGCAWMPGAKEKLDVDPGFFADLPGWREAGAEELAGGLEALRRSCALVRQGNKEIGQDVPERLRKGAEEMGRLCAELAAVTPVGFKAYLEERFCPVALSAREKPFLTGYYLPEVQASRTKGGEYVLPIYAMPAKGPYPSRQEIEEKGLAGAEVLAWARDPVELFFMHVQGSGSLVYPDGDREMLGYAGKNGLPYRSVGGVLVKRGAIPKENMNGLTLKAWLYARPEEAKALMRENPSFIFFRRLPGEGGPIGASGAELTPEHSIAVDPRYVPYGLPIWVDNKRSADGAVVRPLRRLAIAQDTGSAITGPVRADMFFGGGAQAESYAYHQKFTGKMTALVPCERGIGRTWLEKGHPRRLWRDLVGGEGESEG
jgi:membrane-bound lytic murein transglycosylase A